MLNPWSSERPGWELFSDHDKQLLQSALSAITSDYDSSAYTFIVWIPLRSESIAASRGDKYNYILNSQDFGHEVPDFLTPADLPVRLGKLLPMLKRLKSISAYTISRQGTTKLFSLQLNNGAGRCSFPDIDGEVHWQGSVSLESGSDGKLQPLSYAGVEVLVESDRLSALKKNEFWPVSYGRDAAGKEQRILDKTRPHAATILVAQPAKEQAKLTIQWAVFLPLGEQDTSQSKQTFETHIDGNTSFDLFLHGYFFIDAGRVGIHGRQSIGLDDPIEPTSEETATQEWNRLLANEGTLPRILTSVNLAVTELRLNTVQTLALTSGLERYFNNGAGNRYLSSATGTSQWIFQLLPEQKGRWTLSSSQLPTRPLPAPSAGDYGRIWESLPGLNALSREYLLLEQDKPNIKATRNAYWKSDEISTLLQSVPSHVFESQTLLGYLNAFLNSLSYGSLLLNDPCQNALVSLASRVLKETRLTVLSMNQTAVQKFAGFILASYRWAFRVEKDEQKLWNIIAGAETERLIIPAFLDTDKERCKGTLFFDDAVSCLQRLSESKVPANRLEKATTDILSALTSTDKEQLLKQHDTLKLFSAYRPGQKNKPYLESSRTLKALFQNRRLFRMGEGGSFHLGEPLQAALQDHQVAFVNNEVNRELFDAKVHVCDIKAVLHLLTNRPYLAKPEHRVSLISKLEIDKSFSDAENLAVRYLLHSCELDTDLSVELWSGGGDKPIWSALHQETLGSDKAWSMIPYEISPSLRFTGDEKRLINLKEVNARNILDSLGQSIVYVDFSPLVKSQEVAEEILRYVEDESDWKALPLHKTTQGEFVSITEHCALRSDYLLPDALSRNIVWIEPAFTREVQKQQDTYLRYVNAQTAIELALAQETPSQFQSFIIEQLLKIGCPGQIIPGLRTKPWLLVNGKSVAPRHIIAAPVDDWPQCYGLSKEDNSLFFADQLEIFDQPEYEMVKELLLNRSDEIVEVAIKIATQTKGYHIGSCQLTLDVLKQASSHSQAFEKFKGWRLLIECYESADVASLDIELASQLIGSQIDSQLLVDAYGRLVEIGLSPENIAELRTALLTVICAEQSATKLLRKLRLRTQGSGYELAERLCYGVVGAAASSLLHEQDWLIIKRALPEVEQDSTGSTSSVGLADYSSFDRTADELKEYFVAWEPHVTNKLAIAANMALMSGTSGVKEACLPYLGQHSQEHLIEEMGKNWKILESTRDRPVLFSGKTLQQAVASMQFSLTRFEGNKARVHSIFNHEIEVDLESDYRTIFIWESYRFASSTRLGLLLRKLPVMELDEASLLNILKQSAELLLAKVYEQRLSLNHIWDEFSGAEQLDILAAKITMLDGIVHQLRELRLDDKGLAVLIKEYDNEVVHAAEKKGSFGGTERADVLARICKEVEGRKDLQKAILNAVRDKIKQAQYRPQSIPFELFQNADDAVIELGKLEVSQGEIDSRSVFRVKCSNSRLNFLNWGREINQYRVTSSNIDGSAFGFKTDLQKMIARNQSDKGDKTTGKFGLGFKSCLLVTDTPHIVSGRLAVQVEGGLLPNVSDDHEQLFQLARSEILAGSYKPTIVSLPLQEEHTSDSILNAFNRHAGLLPVFAKQIHTIDIDGEQYRWQPRASEMIEGLSFGSVRIPTKKRKTEINIAALKTANGCFVFKLGAKGVIPLDSNNSIPRLWHLAPLLGDIKLGFALNAKFDVDIGRNLLSISSPENRKLFAVLGRELTHFLKQLFPLSQKNWHTVRADWGFSDEVDVATFWGSFWRVLQEGISAPQDGSDSDIEVDSHAELIRQMFNSENGGILSFYESHKALPTGMKGSVPQLISITTVTHRASELLTKISKHMAKLPLLQNYFREEKLVSDTIGRSLIDLGRLIPSLELETLLEEVLVDNYLSPQKAEQIHPVFNSKFDKLLNTEKATQEQVERFKSKLGELKVLTENGGHRLVKETLLRHQPQSDQDEQLVVGFAPGSVIASAQYNQEAVRFIVKCRRETESYKLDNLVSWAESQDVASDIEKKEALCRYIVDGKYGEKLADRIKTTYKPRWLFSDVDVQVLRKWGWDKKSIDLFRNVRMLSDNERNKRIDDQLKREGRSQLTLDKALDKIYDWWDDEGPSHLQEYEKELYPDGQFDWEAIREDSNPDRYKQAWLKLFFLGSCQTIGRTREVQHRAALKSFADKGWWSVFVSNDNPKAWFDVMDEYLADSITGDRYRTWLQILPLYRFSSNLADYIDLFWSAETGLPNINDLIKPGSSSALSGIGFAPPELKATLGIGANFILRELYRHNIYEDDSIVPHCFMASEGVRRLLGNRLPETGLHLEAGASASSSKEIYEFLCENMGEERATFNGAFDIPLRILTRQENREFLEDMLEIGRLELN